MKANPINLILLWGTFSVFPANLFSNNPKKEEVKVDASQTIKKPETSERVFIDRFIVPQKAKPEFTERMNINRNFIKNLPGFIEDAVYARSDEQGNLVYVTVAVWASEEAIKKAKEAVQATYKKEGFNLQAMLERLKVTLVERGVYTKQ